jgi:hypothetical protein
MILPPYKPLEYETVFSADAMFYQSAKASLALARSVEREVSRAQTELQVHSARMHAAFEAVKDDEGDDRASSRRAANYQIAESMAIRMENYEYGVTEAYGPVFQQLALVHILSATSLEAHINIRAEDRLFGRDLKAFERLNVDAKWLFLPKILGCAGFNPGTEPFQGFDAVVAARNRLVHYKPVKEEYKGFDDPEGFAERLGLTFDACERSIASVQGMVSELAKQLGEREPWWFQSDSPHFFITSTKN